MSLAKLFWFDCESTGLDTNKDVILEVAAIITDKNLNILDQIETPVYQPDTILNNMSSWAKNVHDSSGLTQKCRLSPTNESGAESMLISFIEKNQPDTKLIMAGNSIHYDYYLCKQRMPILMKNLHYRLLDVSSFKVFSEIVLEEKYDKVEPEHRALSDILASIKELKHYIQSFNLKTIL